MASADTSVESAGEIEVSVKQQVSAFEQILAAVRQISDGFEQFSTSTRASPEKLKEISASLNQRVKGQTAQTGQETYEK